MPQTEFVLDGVVYGPKEVAGLRGDLIEMRDAALKVNNFDWAISLSHNIAAVAMMGEHIWGDAWQNATKK